MTETAVCTHCKKPVTQETVWIDDGKDIYSSVICAGREDGIGHEPSPAVPQAPGFEHAVDELAQRVIDENNGTSMSAAYRQVAKDLYHTINPIGRSAAPAAQTVPIPEDACPRCSIGKNIFRGYCIVCCGINDSLASILKEQQERIGRAEATIAELLPFTRGKFVKKARARATGKES